MLNQLLQEISGITDSFNLEMWILRNGGDPMDSDTEIAYAVWLNLAMEGNKHSLMRQLSAIAGVAK